MTRSAECLPDGRLEDTYKRHINYLRISITDRCNLRCIYCTPRGRVQKLPHAAILRYEEITRIARIGAALGITKLRITGGEPLVRKGVDAFLEQLTGIAGIKDISLTTNGIVLEKHLDHLRGIGIKRLNISLDTLNPQKYAKITGYNGFERVWSAISAALEKGFSPIKINVVALRGINDGELTDLAALTLRYPFHVRFIEQMPYFGPGLADASPPLTETDIRSIIAPLGELEDCGANRRQGPAARYRIKGAPGEIGFISPVTHHFCKWCNRLRLTSDGWLRSCLLSNVVTDIKTPLRNNATDTELARVIVAAVEKKPLEKGQTDLDGTCGARMFAIGG
ncbi:MAG: GTP 3',8-cyclase MoaA [Desulfosalsimonadaceae bacterium]